MHLILLLILTLFLYFEGSNGVSFTGEYVFTGNRHWEYTDETLTLWICDDTEGESGRIYISLWRFLEGGEGEGNTSKPWEEGIKEKLMETER